MTTIQYTDGTVLVTTTTTRTNLVACSLEYAHEQIRSGDWSVEVFRAWANANVSVAQPVVAPRYVLVRDYAGEVWNVRKLIYTNADGSCVCESRVDSTDVMLWLEWIDITPGVTGFTDVYTEDGKDVDYEVLDDVIWPSTFADAAETAKNINGMLPDPAIVKRMYEIGALRGTTWTNKKEPQYTAYVVGEDGDLRLHGLTNKAYVVVVR